MGTRGDIYEVLHQDHEQVKRLFQELDQEEDEARCLELFQTLRDELVRHSEAEDAVFYALLRHRAETRDMVVEAREEHHVVRVLLGELNRMKGVNEAWRAKVSVLRENVEHHIEMEEDEMFPKAHGVIDGRKAEDVAERFEDRKAHTVV